MGATVGKLHLIADEVGICSVGSVSESCCTTGVIVTGLQRMLVVSAALPTFKFTQLVAERSAVVMMKERMSFIGYISPWVGSVCKGRFTVCVPSCMIRDYGGKRGGPIGLRVLRCLRFLNFR